MPKFMTHKELIDNKYPIDKTYHEQMNSIDISRLETDYERNHTVTSSILQIHEKESIIQISTEQHRHILFIGKYSFSMSDSIQ